MVHVNMSGGMPDVTMLPIPVWIALGLIALIVTIGLYVELFEIGNRGNEFGDRAWGLGLLLVSILFSAIYYVAGARYFYRLAFQRSGFYRDVIDQAAMAGAIFFMSAVPFAALLEYKLGSKLLSEAEKTAGLTGVRVWLRPRYVIASLLIAISLFIGSYEYVPFWVVFLGMMIILLAYPVGRMLQAPQAIAAEQTQPATNLTDERERVLKLLEEGKITTEESVELLNALTESARAETASARRGMSPAQRVKMFGVAVLVIAFFMPWLNVDIAKEVERLTRTLTQSMSQMTGLPQEQFGNANIKITPNLTPGGASQLKGGNTIVLRGGDLNYGLGWAILLLGITAAELPWIAPGMDEMTMRRVTVIAAGAGAILVLYVLFSNFRYVTYGIVAALAGYVLIGLGVVKGIGVKMPNQAAMPNTNNSAV